MLLSRDRGYARARARRPSPMVEALERKRLVSWVSSGEGFAIALTPAGLDVARRG